MKFYILFLKISLTAEFFRRHNFVPEIKFFFESRNEPFQFEILPIIFNNTEKKMDIIITFFFFLVFIEEKSNETPTFKKNWKKSNILSLRFQ